MFIKKRAWVFIKFYLLAILLFILPLSLSVNAQSVNLIRSYQYDSINTTIKVNQDSTFDIEETQVFNFTGNYQKGFRSIPFRKFDAISDISVTDGVTNQELVYSNKKLEKEDPESWGKYTFYRERGFQNIEWYYNLSDTTHTWVIKYKVHGGLEFNEDFDRLYWNIFTDFDVPINNAQVIVTLPGDFDLQKTQIYSYRSGGKSVDFQALVPTHSILFTALEFLPKEAFTIDLSWPKGVVSESAYWWDFLKIYWGYIFSTLAFLTALVVGFIYWLISERLKQGRGTVIPQYKPPSNLRPALAEVITKEQLTSKGLTATIIDLAVRGFIKIEEDPKSIFWSNLGAVLGGVLLSGLALFMFFIVYMMLTYELSASIFSNIFSILIPMGIMGLVGFSFLKRGWNIFKGTTDYKVSKLKSLDGDIEDYEKKYLNILFAGKDYFKTKLLRKSTSRHLFESIKKIKDEVYKHSNTKINVYDVDLIEEKKKHLIWAILFYLSAVALFVVSFFRLELGQSFIFIVFFLVSTVGLYAFIKYEARLNETGRILKEDWLGFKMYLEKAEKYRLQNLTPELFEKYLPYAMVFGIEKKWAKAFEGINMPAPVWYGSGGYHGGYGGGSLNSSGSSFSPSTFSASFASSFSSSFGSAGASGGGGGGGGGAGGGGGGGGGGAG